jgi:SAM-dependent MidA family methyltransferase
VFAHCVRDALLDTWRALGEPDPFRVVELGAGDGTLAQALLEAFAELPMPHVDYVGVEISPGARDALAARGLATLERLDT